MFGDGLVAGRADRLTGHAGDRLTSLGLSWIAVVPVRTGDVRWGYLGFAHTGTRRPWTKTETDALRTAASVIGAAVARSEAGSKERLQAEILDHIVDAVVVSNDRNEIVYWNEAATRIYGWSASEAVGAIARDLLHPELSDEQLAQIVRSLEERGRWQGEVRHRRKDGGVIELAADAASYVQPDGTRLLVSVNHDLTARRRTERALERSEAYRHRLAAIVESTDDAVIGRDLDGTIVSWNAAAEHLYGFTEREMIGRKDTSTIPADGVEEFNRAIATAAGGSVVRVDTVRLHHDGTRIPVALTTSPIRRSDGTIVGTSAITRDITERVRAREALDIEHARLQRFVDANVVGIVIADAAGHVLQTNDYYLNVIGFTREEFDRGEVDWRAITPPEWLPADEHAIDELREHGVCTPYEKEYVRRDGTRVPVFLADAMYPGPGDQIIAFVLDITERSQAERAVRDLARTLERRVRERTAELEAANRELEAFSYSVSHDLRAPLRAIQGFARILETEHVSKLDPEALRILRVVTSSTDRMAQLIDDLLAFSRITRRELKRTEVDMQELARSVVEEVSTRQADRHVEVRIDPLCAARGDVSLLRQALLNLVDNAFKFTRGTGDARIEVLCEREGDETVYLVRDNGVGYDDRYADKLFKVFQRLHSAADFEGTGVGLALVERIVDRHGGRVGSHGSPGNGATFWFALPTS